MSSKRKSSTKSRRDHSVSEGSSSQHVGVVPKAEFPAEPIYPEEVDAWRTATGEVIPPTHVLWIPSNFKPNPVPGCPSMSCPNGLAAIRHSCKISESVKFRLPDSGEVALSPPEGYFTQVNPCGLQHLDGILVLSYEPGITLDADHLEAWVEP
ncbi:hypothetical protein DY000_02014980 [Brassica cretica]|uniref:Uncharacterized protein n=1 Tax=Brassica cretica TaxID=69181 RepID=A0ABQ7D1A8_BRACR|nr:hypothetical protein DY000_02014980 [Brassica cretica]